LNAKHCVLAHACNLADSESCTRFCPHFIATDARLKAANVPREYRLITLKNSPVRASEPTVYKTLDAYVKTFIRAFNEPSEPIKSVYLYSPTPGNGKTTTAIALLHEYLIRHYVGSLQRGRQPEQVPVYFLDVNEFQTRYNLATMTGNENELEAIRNEIRRCQFVPFLVMDDIGVRGASDAFRSYLHSIINHRTTHSLPTIYTSNIPLERRERERERDRDERQKTFAEVFDERLYDRVRDMCIVLPFGGESKRGLRR
jgi:DNA replication protein DnaC